MSRPADANAALLSPPPLTGHVLDTAGLMTADKSRDLEAALVRYERATGHQIVVLSVPTLEGENIEEFALRTAETYGLGRRKAAGDDGVLMVLAQKEHRARIEVGLGLEGLLGDIVCGRIIRDVMAPRLAQGQSQSAIFAGVDRIMELARAEGEAQATEDNVERPQIGPLGLLLIVALALFMLWAVGPGPLCQMLFLLGNTRGGGRGEDRFGGKGGRFGGGGASGGW